MSGRSLARVAPKVVGLILVCYGLSLVSLSLGQRWDDELIQNLAAPFAMFGAGISFGWWLHERP